MDDNTDNTDLELESMMHPADILTDEELEAQRNLLAAKEAVYGQRCDVDADAEYARFRAGRNAVQAPHNGRARHGRAIIVALLSAAAVATAVFYLSLPATDHEDGAPVAKAAKALPKGMVYQADKADSVVRITADDGSQYSLPDEAGEEIDTRQLAEVAQELTITIPKGKSYKLNLADGSSVYMYADSRLTFPTAFVGERREVRLVGKAYFNVAHNEAMPFVVHTPRMSTTVLGTQFFVEADEANDAKVTLISGRVEVATAKERKLISPGQQTRIGANGSMTVARVDLDHYTYWRDGFLYYDNADMIDVMRDIGREYNCNIIFHNEEMLHYKIHFVAERSRSIDNVVDMLNQLGHFKIVHDGDSVIVDATEGS